MKFIAVSYWYPDLCKYLSIPALKRIEHVAPIPLTIEFDDIIGQVLESKVVGERLISYGHFYETQWINFQALSGFGVPIYVYTYEKRKRKLVGISITSRASRPSVDIIRLENTNA